MKQILIFMAGVLAFAVLAAAAPKHIAETCPRPIGWTGAKRITGKTWQAWWQTTPAAVPIGAHFQIRFHVCGPAVRKLRVRGWMPAHQHGMNYRPTVALKGRTGTAKGLLFHMPGKWQLMMEIRGGGQREKLTAEMQLE